MQIEPQTAKSFSIFDPAISYEHREFYEKILSELNGIFPICNQGECTAVDISENSTEQEQITELMKRVENFSKELLDVTKKLFDQFYVAKEELHQSILNTTAYNKINTLDRNLLERTCDVRWWALETAFSDCIGFYEATKENATKLAGGLQGVGTGLDGEESREFFDYLHHFERLLGTGKLERMKALVESLAERMGEGSLTGAVKAFGKAIETLDRKITFACDRLEDINNSYTLYRDLIIAGKDGFVIASSNNARRETVLGLDVNEETWFKRALLTKNGTEYFAQDLSPSAVESRLSLVYSTAVRENSDENGKVVGAMGVFFDFQGEANIILEEYMPRDERGSILDGCYSMFTNRAGEIIASSDESILKIGEGAHIPKRNRQPVEGERVSNYMVFEGVDSAIFSAKTDGYLDYKGLEWSSHVIIPKEQIFSTTLFSETLGISPEELMGSRIIPEINKQTYLKVQDDKESIQLISLNGIVFASKLGRRGAALGPIFNQITRTGDFVTSRMEDLLREMALGELDLNLKALENFSKQAIDLIDRNLFERSADIRWWATDEYFWKALMNPSEEHFRKAGERLKVINGSYTMYRNLVLADSRGEIVACSRTEMRNELMKINVSDQYWFQQGMRTSRSSEYAVQDAAKSNLERTRERSLIYSGGVRNNGTRDGESIGVLGILFDWDTEAGKILLTCLPQDASGARIEGSAAFYANKVGEVIETTDSEKFPVGLKLQLPKSITGIGVGESVSDIWDCNGVQYIVGSSKTKGYREYAGLEWTAHIVRPVY
jgi:hypothetical protein